MIISIPTGVKVFNWLFTMYRGRVRFDLPMMWTVAFMLTFVIGGMTGVLLAVPPADFVLHNSLFLIAHFQHRRIKYRGWCGCLHPGDRCQHTTPQCQIQHPAQQNP